MAQGEQRPVPSCSWVFDWGSALGVGGGWAGSTRAACDEKQKRLSAGACPSSQGRGGDCRACACPRQTFRGTLPLSIVSGGGGCSGGSCLQAHTDAHERALTLVMGQLWQCGHTNLPRPQHPSWCGHKPRPCPLWESPAQGFLVTTASSLSLLEGLQPPGSDWKGLEKSLSEACAVALAVSGFLTLLPSEQQMFCTCTPEEVSVFRGEETAVISLHRG